MLLYAVLLSHTYTCRIYHEFFQLIFAVAPPAPGRPFIIKAQSTSVTIGWPEYCTGGHTLSSFTIQYREVIGSFSYHYVRNIDPSQRSYTITELETRTQYSFRVQAVSTRTSSYSLTATASTLAPGSPYLYYNTDNQT